MKSPLCTLTHKWLSNNTNCAIGGVTWFRGFQDEKQNEQPF
jgi:hypothetical protein